MTMLFMNMRLRISILAFIAIILGCSCSKKWDLDVAVKDYWEENYVGDTVILNLKDITPFQWDSVIYFTGFCDPYDIVDVFGCLPDPYDTGGDRIYFLLNDEIVYRKIWYNGWYDNEYPDYVYIDLDVYKIYENPSVVFKRYEEEIAPGEFKEYREPQPAYAVYKKDEAVFLVEKKDPPGCFRLLKYKVDR